MNKFAFGAALAATVFVMPAAAFAQDGQAEVTLGVTAGYHDLGIADEVEDLTGLEVEDGSPIFGLSLIHI